MVQSNVEKAEDSTSLKRGMAADILLFVSSASSFDTPFSTMSCSIYCSLPQSSLSPMSLYGFLYLMGIVVITVQFVHFMDNTSSIVKQDMEVPFFFPLLPFLQFPFDLLSDFLGYREFLLFVSEIGGAHFVPRIGDALFTHIYALFADCDSIPIW